MYVEGYRQRGLDYGATYCFTLSRLDSLAVGSLIAIAITGGVSTDWLASLARRVVPVCAAGLILCAVLGRSPYFTNLAMLTAGISLVGPFYGGLLILVMLYEPKGLVGLARRLAARARRPSAPPPEAARAA